jgi:hypothetical protein
MGSAFLKNNSGMNMRHNTNGHAPYDANQRSRTRQSSNVPLLRKVHARIDRYLPKIVLRFYLALRMADVPAELHIFESAPYRVGLASVSDGKSMPHGRSATSSKLGMTIL